MLKKIIAVLLVGLLLVGCSNGGGKKGSEYSGPSKVAYDFISSLRELDVKKMGDQLAVESEKPSQQDVEKSMQGADLKSAKEIVGQFVSDDIKIANEKIDGDKATVDVTLKTPEPQEFIKKLTAEAMGLAMEGNMQNMSPEESAKKMLSLMKSVLKDIKRIEVTGTLHLEKVGSDWKVSSMNTVNNKFLEQITEKYGDFMNGFMQ